MNVCLEIAKNYEETLISFIMMNAFFIKSSLPAQFGREEKRSEHRSK